MSSGTARRILVEAPAGYGKTRRLHQLAPTYARVTAAADFAEASASLRDGDGDALVIVDDLHRWHIDEQRKLAELIAYERPEPSVAIATRAVPRSVSDLLMSSGALLTDIADLRLGIETIGELFGDTHTDEQLADLTSIIDGWPVLAHALALDTDGRATPLGANALQPTTLSVVNEYLADLDPVDRRHLEQLSHIEVFTTAAVDALSAGLFDRLRTAGVPLERTATGSVRLIRPVRDALRYGSEIDAAAAEALVQPLLQSGLQLDAVRILLRTGQTHDAAHALSQLGPAHVDSIASDDLLTALSLTTSCTAKYPRLGLVRARALGNAARLDEQLEVLREVAAGSDSPEAFEASAEALYVRASLGDDVEQCRVDLDTFERETSGDITAAIRARLHDARSMLLAQSDDPDELIEALTWSRRATDEWLTLGDHLRATSSIRIRIMSMLLRLGWLGEAERDIQRALELPQVTLLERLSNLVVATQIDGLTGRRDDHTVSEAASLAEALQVRWAQSYVCWSRMVQESIEPSDADAVLDNYEAAWALLGELKRHGTGAALRADAVEALARVGRFDTAAELLALMSDSLGANDPDVRLARLAYLACLGDHHGCAAVARVLDSDGVAPAWRVAAQVAVGARRAGRAEAVALVATARSLAREAGCEAAIDRIWPELDIIETDHAALGAASLADRQTTTISDSGEPSIEIQALGGFSVRINGEPVKVRSQNVALLLKTLVLGQRRAVVDVVIDRLWPDADIRLGRRRLKNVMSRCRDLLGDAIHREHDVLVLDDSVRVDVLDFREACQQALHDLARDDKIGVPTGLAALRMYRGELLPDDLYDDDIAPLRIAEAHRATAVVDSIMSRTSNASVVASMLDAILTIAPDDQIRLSRFQRWAEQCGQPEMAASVTPLIA